MKKITLSFCLIVKNEESMLEDCLRSIRDIANEIIVVDTGSTDNTVKIANKYRCNVIHSTWQNDFSKARNISIENATGSHIFIIDADERLTNPYQVIPSIENCSDDVGGWLVKNVSKVRRENGAIETFSNDILRLFVNDRKIRYQGIIHEQVINSVIANNYKIHHTSIELLHLGYGHSIEKMSEKTQRNLELLNKHLEAVPTDYYNYFQRAKTHLAMDNLAAAEQDFLSVTKYANIDSAILPQAYSYGGLIAAKMGDFDLAISRALESLKLLPFQALGNLILGDCYSQKDRFDLALNYYLEMEKAPKQNCANNVVVSDYYLPAEEMNFKIGKCYLAIKEYEKAERYFISGKKHNPNNPMNDIGIANIAFVNKEYEKARNILETLQNNYPENKDIAKYLNQLDNSEKTIQLRKDKESIKGEIDLDSIVPIKLNKSNPLISLSMIVKNEEKFLPDCLESVRGIVDEIIVVDTGSSDRTVEIAKRYGADVHHIEWRDDFAYARNESIRRCTGQWILYLDADERISEDTKIEVRPLALYSPQEVGGYICNIESLHLQNDGKTNMHRGGYPRFFRNYGYPTIRFQGRIHEQISPSIFDLNKAIDFSKIVIKHLGYDTSLEVMEKKVRRNYNLLIKHVQDEPENAYAWFQLAQTLGKMELYKESEDALQMALSLGTLKSSIASSAYSLLTQYERIKKNYDEAIRYANLSLEIAPEQVYTTFQKALCYMEKGDPEIAEPIVLEVIEMKKRKRGTPLSGFDIELDDDYISKGLAYCRKLIEEKKSGK